MQLDNASEIHALGIQRRLHLLYHELRPRGSAYSYVVDTDAFERHLEVYKAIRAGGEIWPEITFDDGHCSNYEFALPRLAAQQLTARFFITVGWTGQKSAYMGWEQLRALQKECQQIGAHGWTHTLLTHCDAKQLDTELRVARLTLEEKLGVAVTTMSLPGGRHNRRVLAACREAGYTQVYTSVPRAETLPLGESIGRLNIRGDVTLEQLTDLFARDSLALTRMARQYRIKEVARKLLGDTAYARLWAVLNRQEQESDEAPAE